MTKLTLSTVIEAIERGDARLIVERTRVRVPEDQYGKIVVAVDWLENETRDVLVVGDSLVTMAPEIMRLAR